MIELEQNPNSWTYNLVEVPGYNLESSRTFSEVSIYNIYITKQFQPLLLKRGGGVGE